MGNPGREANRWGHLMAQFVARKMNWSPAGDRKGNVFVATDGITVVKSAEVQNPAILVTGKMFPSLCSITLVKVSRDGSASVYNVPRQLFSELKKEASGKYRGKHWRFYTDDIAKKCKSIMYLLSQEVNKVRKEAKDC